jgi:hypothetical protein
MNPKRTFEVSLIFIVAVLAPKESCGSAPSPAVVSREVARNFLREKEDLLMILGLMNSVLSYNFFRV